MIRRREMLLQMGLIIPPFMNHMEYGTINRSDTQGFNIQFNSITNLRGMVVYNSSFDLLSAKANKPVLGAYAAFLIIDQNINDYPVAGVYKNVSSSAFYYVNWGAGTNQEFPTARTSRTESRGIPYYKPEDKIVYMHGFGTGDYDFKLNTDYNWIAWD